MKESLRDRVRKGTSFGTVVACACKGSVLVNSGCGLNYARVLGPRPGEPPKLSVRPWDSLCFSAFCKASSGGSPTLDLILEQAGLGLPGRVLIGLVPSSLLTPLHHDYVLGLYSSRTAVPQLA